MLFCTLFLRDLCGLLFIPSHFESHENVEQKVAEVAALFQITWRRYFHEHRRRFTMSSGGCVAITHSEKLSNRLPISRLLVGAVLLAAAGLTCVAMLDADARTWMLWRNTAELSLGTILLAVPIGTFLAIVIHRTDAWGTRWAWSILFALVFIPLYLHAAAWDAWFGRQGWVWPAQDYVSRRLAAAICIHAAASIPWVALIVGAGLRQIDPELEESAWLQMSPFGVLARVTLPLSAPAILAAMWWVVVLTTSEITVTDIYQIRTYAEEVYTTIPLLDSAAWTDASPFDAPGAATLPRGFWAVAGWMVVSLAFVGLIARHDFPVASRRPLKLDLGAWRIPFTGIMLVVLVFLAAVPLMNLVLDAGQYVSRAGMENVQRWSAAKCVSMIATSPWSFRRELLWTIVIASSAATGAVALALPLAWFARRRSLAAIPACVVAALSAAIPGPVVALWIIELLNGAENRFCVWLYDRTIFAPALATTIRALPVAILVSWWGCRTVPEELVDASRLDGLSAAGRLVRVVWPLRREVFVAAWLAALAVAAGDLSASILVTPPGISTLPVRIFGLIHAGVDDRVAGICLTNVLLSVVVGILTLGRLRRASELS